MKETEKIFFLYKQHAEHTRGGPAFKTGNYNSPSPHNLSKDRDRHFETGNLDLFFFSFGLGYDVGRGAVWARVRCGPGYDVGWGAVWAGVRCGLGCGVGRGAVWAGVRCEPRWGVGRGAVWAEVWCGPGCGVGRGAVWAGVRCGPGCGVVRGGGIGDSDGGRCQECDISKCMQTNGQRVDGKMTSLTQFVVTDPSPPPRSPTPFLPTLCAML